MNNSPMMHISIRGTKLIKFTTNKFEIVITSELLNTLPRLLLNYTLPLFKGLENIRFILQKINLEFPRKVINKIKKLPRVS